MMASCIGFVFLAYPLYVMAGSGSVLMALLAQIALVAMFAAYAGPSPAMYSEIFPTRIRFTALSLGYNMSVMIFGGFAPFIATFLIKATGYDAAPSFYVIAAALIACITLMRVKETAFSPLR